MNPNIKAAFFAETTTRLDDCADRLLGNATALAVATILYRLSGERVIADHAAAIADMRRVIHELVEIAATSALGFLTQAQERQANG